MLVSGSEVKQYEPYGAMPSPIQTVGQNGSVEIEVCNKNMLGLEDIEEHTSNGITYSCKNGILKVNGTATSSFGIILKHNKFTLFSGIKYVAKMRVTNVPGINTSVINIRDMNSKSRFYMECWVNPKIIEITPEDNIYFKDDENTNLWINSGTIFSNTEFMIQIETNTSSTDCIPHKSYTKVLPIQEEMLDEDYISDKEYHNWKKIESYNGEEITTYFKSTTGELTTGATVYYKLAEPKELELTEEQKAVFYTYKNITNISIDGIATLKVNYKKDLETIINNLSATSVAE